MVGSAGPHFEVEAVHRAFRCGLLNVNPLNIALQHGLFVVVIFAMAAAFTRVVIGINISDVPNHRSSHKDPTPKSGGIAIALAFFFGVIAVFVLNDTVRIDVASFVWFIGLCAAALLFSLADDIFSLKPRMKLLFQTLSAITFAVFVSHISDLWAPGLGTINLGWFGYVLTVLWIVFFMNALNFVDGLNGLAAGGSIVAGVFLAILAMKADAPFVYLAAITISAAVAGFFPFNFPTARVFMGDTGSQFLGFVFGCLAVIASQQKFGGLHIYVAPILFLPFIFDVVLTLGHRLVRGQKLAEAHREHIYQLMNRLGMSHTQVSLIYFAYFMICGIAALRFQTTDPTNGILIIAGLLVMFSLHAIAIFVNGRRRGLL
jgi:UDP-GlcNAc:undecaprenyl-phosphate GlcNAc-1-phosphate transferase